MEVREKTTVTAVDAIEDLTIGFVLFEHWRAFFGENRGNWQMLLNYTKKRMKSMEFTWVCYCIPLNSSLH